jgi:putative transport protein
MGMDAVMAWGHGNAVAWAVLVLSLVAVVGLTIGSIKLPGGVKLGIGGALFAGIGFAHFGVTIEESILDFCREFGLILFVYAIGLQVGPGFFNALRRQGLALNLLAAGLVVLGVLTTAFVHLGLSVPLPAALGIMSGATTTPRRWRRAARSSRRSVPPPSCAPCPRWATPWPIRSASWASS